jgi:hypothetical protein
VPGTWVPVLLAAITVASCAQVLRLGYFADDFIFLDAARRQPWSHFLLGWHGIRPWYRPLSRELFFALAGAAGAAGPMLAHVLSIATLAVAADSFWRVTARRLGATVASVAAALLLCHSLTYLLCGWLSGYQDLLAMALTMLALRLRQDGRFRAAIVLAALAPLAKETAFLAVPLLAADVVLNERRRPTRREVLLGLAAIAAPALVHVLARATWPHLPAASAPPLSLVRGLPVVALALQPWTHPPGPAPAEAWLAAALVGVLVLALLLAREPESPPPSDRASLSWPAVLLLLAALPGAATLVSPRLQQQAHFFYPAIPWACVLAAVVVARLLPVPWLRILVPVVCATCAWSGFARPVDLTGPNGWRIEPLAWGYAQRIEARTRALGGQLQSLLTPRPEGLLVGFVHIPAGAWLQTSDGPALRVLLHDPTVHGRMVQDLSPDTVADVHVPVALLDMDPTTGQGFQVLDPADPKMGVTAAQLAIGDAEARAAVLAAYASRPESSGVLPRYLGAAAAFLEDGDRGAFARRVLTAQQAEGGLIDPSDSTVSAALRAAVDQPLAPGAHARSADALANAPVFEALERAVAVRLDSTRAGDALRLARLLRGALPRPARRAYALAARPGAPAGIIAAARRESATLPAPR